MDGLQFLRTVWPAKGIYCIAHGPYKAKNGKTVPYVNGFNTIEEAIRFALEKAKTVNVWFCTHTHRGFLIDERNGRKYVKRGGDNEAYCQIFYSDLDFGPEATKYANRAEALAGLKAFLETTGLPWPLIVSSGNGMHCYWIMSSPLDSDVWAGVAKSFQAVARHHGLRCDHQVTADKARMLRIPGTWNRKDQNHIKQVKVVHDPQTVTDTHTWMGLIARLQASLPTPAVVEAREDDEARSEQDKPTFKDVGDACAAFRRLAKTAARHTETEWFKFGHLNLFVRDGMKFFHQLSSRHPDYDRAATDEKLRRQREMRIGAPSCANLQETIFSGPNSPCSGCWFFGRDGGSPITAAILAPQKVEDGGLKPPKGFAHVKAGISFLDKPPALPKVISPYDMKPIDIIDDPIAETKAVEWDVTFPLTGTRRVRLPIAIHADPRMLSILGQRGILIQTSDQKVMGRFMSSYIRQLQEYQREMQQHSRLGITQDTAAWISPEKVYTRTGTARSVLGQNLANIAAMIKRSGTRELQISAMSFYNKPEYRPQQFVIGASLGAILFHMTGHAGAMINLYGDSGASKTTAVMGACSLHGSLTYVMSGSSSGSTYNARIQRMNDANTYPVFMDEITLLDPEALKNLVLDISQGGERGRLGVTAAERKMSDQLRSLLVISSSNNSVHDTISTANRAGNAGSMRVMDIRCERTTVDTRAAAEDFLRTIKANHGHIGAEFVAWIMQHYDEVRRDLDRLRADIIRMVEGQQHERFWLDQIACVVMALVIARRLGLLPYDPQVVLQWAITEALTAQREAVEDAYTDPLQTLTTFIERSQGAFLKVDGGRDGSWFPVSGTAQPNSGAGLSGRYEVPTRRLYITCAAFKDYCSRSAVSYRRVVQVLRGRGLVSKIRMTLGRGVPEYATAQTECLLIDMGRAELSGVEAPEKAEKVVQLRRA